MTDKTKTKPAAAAITLSTYGIYRSIGSFQSVAQECIQHYRESSEAGQSLGAFKAALSDLTAALTALDGLMNLPNTDPYCNDDFSFYEIGRIVAFADAAGVNYPAGIRGILAKQDMYFPLEFLSEVEALRFRHPHINFELAHAARGGVRDDEIPF